MDLALREEYLIKYCMKLIAVISHDTDNKCAYCSELEKKLKKRIGRIKYNSINIKTSARRQHRINFVTHVEPPIIPLTTRRKRNS
jgi:hypothetical protein